MNLARAARLLIAVALLVAQQAALAHQVWHLGKQDWQPAQSQLCEQHDALATVAGALDSASADVAVPAADRVPHSLLQLPTAPLPPLAPVSRGPPSLL